MRLSDDHNSADTVGTETMKSCFHDASVRKKSGFRENILYLLGVVEDKSITTIKF